MLYIFDKDDNFKNIITEDTGLIDTRFKDYQNHLIDEPFVFHVDSESELLPLIVAENQVAFKHTFNALQQDVEMLKLMRIKEIDEIYNSDGYIVRVQCEPSWLELYDHFIEDRRIENGTAQTAMNRALQGSRWVGQVAGEFGNGSTNFYWIDAVEALFKIVEEWGGVLHDYITLDEENEIATRIMYLLPRLGRDNGLLIQPGYNAELIERRTLSYPKTALWGQGASLEIEDDEGNHTGGYSRYLTFEDVEWSKAKGDPVDKPKGQKWVGDPQALAKYGELMNDGTRNHRFGHFSNQDYETPEELLYATWDALQKIIEPEVYHEAVIDEVDKPIFLGDTGTILDRHYGKPIEVQSQITGLEYDILRPKENVNIVLGNYKDMSRDPLEDEIDEIKKEQGRPPIINDNSFPDVKPGTPVNVEAVGMFRAILVSWEYDSKIYISHYEVYASQTADFVPDAQFLVYRGRVSSYGHEVGSNETWYYRVRAVNTHGTTSEFSVEVSASSTRIDFIDLEDEIKQEIQDTKDRAEEAYDNANLATQNAMDAIDKAQQGFDAAQDAIIQAGTANTKADQSLSQAQSAFNKAQESIDGLTTLVGITDEQGRELTSIKGSVQGLQASVTDLDDNVASLQMTSQSLAGRLTDAEGNLTTVSATVKGLQTQVSDVEGNVSTVTQLANVLERRMTDSEGNISSLQSTASSLSSRIGEIESDISDEELTKKLGTENINRSYERDLLTSGKPFLQGEYSIVKHGDENVLYNNGKYSMYISDYIPNTTDSLHYVEMDVLYKGNTEGTIYIQLLFYSKNKTQAGTNGLALNFVGNKSVNRTGEWQRFNGFIDMSKQSVDRKNAYYVGIRVLVRYKGINQDAYIKNLSWKQLNSQDSIQRFSVIDQTIDSIATRVQTNADNYSSMTQTVKGIQNTVANKADKTTVTQLAGVVDTKISTVDANNRFATQSQLTQTSNSLTSTITSVKNDLDGLEIGGRNLIKNSGNFTDTSGWSTGTIVEKDGYKAIEVGSGILNSSYRATLEPNTYYVYSGWLMSSEDYDSKNISGNQPLHYQIPYDGSNSAGYVVHRLISKHTGVIPANTWFRVVVLIKTREDNSKEKLRFRPFVYNGRGFTDVKYWARDFQLEKGNKATDWSPAPEDMATQSELGEWGLFTISQISQLDSAINLRVQKGDVINQINLDTSGVLISGKKLVLDGDTTVTGNFRVRDANIASIEAGKITGGTADFAKFSAININANSINSGTLNTDVMRVRGGSSTEYTLIDGARLESRGKYTRSWFGETEKNVDVAFRVLNGHIRFENFNEDKRLYYSDRGISTFIRGYDDEDTNAEYHGSGVIEFFSHQYSNVARGLTLFSNRGVLALKTNTRDIVLDSDRGVDIYGQRNYISLYPNKDNRPGINEFRFYVTQAGDSSETDGQLNYGSSGSAQGFGSGLRFSKYGKPWIFATDGSGTKGTGNFWADGFYGDLKPKGAFAYVRAPRLRIINHETNSSTYGDIQMAGGQAYFMRLNTDGDRTFNNFFMGVSSGEFRVVTNKTIVHDNFNNATYRPVRARSFIESSSRTLKTDIKAYEDSAMDVIRSLTVVNYRFKDDVERGVNLQQIGFISEDSPAIATADNMAIQTTKLASYLTKGVQELDSKINLTREELVLKIAKLERRINELECA